MSGLVRDFLVDIMNAPLDIPVISWVFEFLTGVKLTYGFTYTPLRIH
jgi:hypothetical protein